MQYRREIDGLRTVAVVPVILFHAGFERFGGGFVGVDIFFVISGYLITTILLLELERGDLSLLRFYERRARRILPALFVVMAACIPFAWFLMLPAQYDAFARSVVAVVFFASNILFWREQDYFGAAAELKPLIHTWSLAVEEQYYLLFPLFLLLLWRFGRRPVLWTILVIAALSLMLGEWGWRYQPSANFYLAPTRIWELLAGSVCAFLTLGRPQRSSALWSGIGLALILFAIFVYDSTTPFPSLYALVPVIGAVLIVLFAGPGTPVARLLSTAPFVGIGLISYSAYLWHQPLFAFARLWSLAEPGPLVMGLLAVLSLMLAYVTWRFVEQPVRRRQVPLLATRGGIFAASGLIGAAFVVFGMQVRNEQFALSRLDARQQRLLSYLQFSETPAYFESYRNPDCFYGPKQNSFSVFRKETCLAMSAEKPNVLLLGDSHAAHLWHGLTTTFPDINFLQATASGCLPMQPLKGAARCTDMLDFLWNDFLPAHHLDVILLAGRWDLDDMARVPGTLAALAPFADRIIVIGPIVEYQPHLPILLAQTKTDAEAPAYVRRFADRDRFAVSAVMKREVERLGAGFVDISGQLCSGQDCMAWSDDGEPMSWDYGHFTPTGAQTIIRHLRDSGALDFAPRAD